MKNFIEKNSYLFMFLFTLVCAMAGFIDTGYLLAEGVAGTDSVGKFEEDTASNAMADENSPQLLRKYINQKIVEHNPESTPLYTIFKEIENKRIDNGEMKGNGLKSMIYDYYAVDTKPVKDSIKTAYAYVAGAETATIEVATPKMFSKRDTITVRGVAGYDGSTVSTTKPLALWVESKTADGKLVVRALNGKTIGTESDGKKEVPGIAAGKTIYRLGRAHDELEVMTSPFTAWPSKVENYCQIFKAQINAGSIYQLQAKELNWTPKDNERIALDDMKRTMEASFLFGQKSKIAVSLDDDRSGFVYTTDGIVPLLTNVIDFDGTSFNQAFFNSMERSVFTGNSGSSKRFMFMGSGFTEKVSNLSDIQRQIGAKETSRVYGMDFNEIISPFGSLLTKRHELMDMYGYEDCAIILDINNVSKVNFSGVERSILDLKKTGKLNADAAVITEIAGTELYYPKTHALVKPSTFTTLG